ncbi:MAG: rod shape-determining protein [Candidatus Kaiserbacteria bacterium]|nr:rod shape-determining protein [Candidatus Kaiserbacteria bacterium]
MNEEQQHDTPAPVSDRLDRFINRVIKGSPGKKKEKSPVSWLDTFTNRVGIDLGTATTVVYVDKQGIILREPTLVAVNTQTDQVVSIGKKARIMTGRTPNHIKVVQPIRQGVIDDYEVTEQLFEHIFRKVQETSPKILGPVVTVGIPCKTSQTEINAVRDAAMDAGARRVHIVYEPFAAAVGMDLDLDDDEAFMVIDVGGGTSDTMIFAGGEVVASDSIRIAGDAFDEAIAEGLREKKRLVVGSRVSEDLKIAVMQATEEQKAFRVPGRNSENGLPLDVEVSFSEVISYITPRMEQIAGHIRTFVERSSPEVLVDLKQNGIYFVGGGPAIYTFSKKIEEVINLKVTVPENPTVVVAKGTAMIAKHADRYQHYFLS